MFINRLLIVIPRKCPRVPKTNLDQFLPKKGRMPRRAAWLPIEQIFLLLEGTCFLTDQWQGLAFTL